MDQGRCKIGLVFLCGILAACSGSAGGTPATEIPAPVAHLSLSSPDSDGNVRVTAEADFADAGSSVTITNTSVESSWLFFERVAWAATTLTANADGSFQTTVAGSIGDEIKVDYTKDGQEEMLAQEVPDNVPALPLTAEVQDVSLDPVNAQVLVVANDGTDGFVYAIDLDDNSLGETVELAGAAGASRIATDPTTGQTIVLDTANDNAWHITWDGSGAVVATTAIIGSSDLAAGTTGGYVVIAHTDATPAMSYFDLTNDSATATGEAQNEEGDRQQTSTLIDLANNGTADVAGLISLMPDDTQLLTVHLIDPLTPAIVQNGAIALDGIGTPAGLALFSNASEALITDADYDSVLRILLNDGTTTEIAVGEAPRGVAVKEAENLALVANATDDTVSQIDLASDRVTDTTEVGLSPTAIAVDHTETVSVAIVLNTGDETVSILE